MTQLVQAAMDAAQQGDKHKALELIEQALHTNPNDVSALLIMATLVDESTRKRQILNRVLSLEATNKAARDMLLEMDRAEINSHRSLSSSASVLKTQSPLGAAGSSQSHLPQKPSTVSLEKPMSFRYPAALMTILYVFTTFSCCGTLWYATINIAYSFPFLALFLAMALVLGITALTVSTRVEADENVVRVSSWVRSVEMNWSEIASIEFDSLKRNLELRSNIGELATISTQIQDYKILIELLRQKRPDLFSEAIFSPKPLVMPSAMAVQTPPGTRSESMSAAGSNRQPEPRSATSTTSSKPAPFSSQPYTVPAPNTASSPAVEKPLVFRYSTIWLIGLYLSATIFCLSGLLVASQSIVNSLPALGLALLFGLTALSLSSKTEVTGMGIRTSSLLSNANIEWKDIVHINSNAAKRKFELVSGNGKSVNISTQVDGYPVFIEMVRQKRPDLFSQATSALQQPELSVSKSDSLSPAGVGQSASTSAFTEPKTFQKSFVKQYGMLFALIPAVLFFVWLSSASSDTRTAFLAVAAFCALMIVLPFFQVSGIRVEPNKLTIETFFEQKEFAARQIKEIKMQSIHGRYGRVTNIVNIIPAEGKNYPLGGFRDGDEIVYGNLINWWNTYRNQ